MQAVRCSCGIAGEFGTPSTRQPLLACRLQCEGAHAAGHAARLWLARAARPAARPASNPDSSRSRAAGGAGCCSCSQKAAPATQPWAGDDLSWGAPDALLRELAVADVSCTTPLPRGAPVVLQTPRPAAQQAPFHHGSTDAASHSQGLHLPDGGAAHSGHGTSSSDSGGAGGSSSSGRQAANAAPPLAPSASHLAAVDLNSGGSAAVGHGAVGPPLDGSAAGAGAAPEAASALQLALLPGPLVAPLDGPAARPSPAASPPVPRTASPLPWASSLGLRSKPGRLATASSHDDDAALPSTSGSAGVSAGQVPAPAGLRPAAALSPADAADSVDTVSRAAPSPTAGHIHIRAGRTQVGRAAAAIAYKMRNRDVVAVTPVGDADVWLSLATLLCVRSILAEQGCMPVLSPVLHAEQPPQPRPPAAGAAAAGGAAGSSSSSSSTTGAVGASDDGMPDGWVRVVSHARASSRGSAQSSSILDGYSGGAAGRGRRFDPDPLVLRIPVTSGLTFQVGKILAGELVANNALQACARTPQASLAAAVLKRLKAHNHTVVEAVGPAAAVAAVRAIALARQQLLPRNRDLAIVLDPRDIPSRGANASVAEAAAMAPTAEAGAAGSDGSAGERATAAASVLQHRFVVVPCAPGKPWKPRMSAEVR